ncbi:MAG: hypothetical protein D6742_15660 [Cyanobacteria bacterium J069]|nr:MAG: hypothetical protein D6742_15660 [Cyanobacteria bacterium J069]
MCGIWQCSLEQCSLEQCSLEQCSLEQCSLELMFVHESRLNNDDYPRLCKSPIGI